MEDLQYIPCIKNGQHLITLKDIFSYYDVKKITGNGNLRMIYSRKDKRDLAISIFNVYIAELLDSFVEGGVIFNFPDKIGTKMMFKTISEDIVKECKRDGKLKLLDPIGSNFKGVETVIRQKFKEIYYNTSVRVSPNFQKKIYDKINSGKSLLGKKDTYWNDYTEIIYNSYSEIDKKSIDHIILFGLRKMCFFLSKNLEIFFSNKITKDYFYIGKQINKNKNVNLRYEIMTKQYIKKLRWHYASKKEYSSDRYYHLTEEMYKKHITKEKLDVVILKKIKEECLIGQPWYKYIMKTNTKAVTFSKMIRDYDSSNDELIFIKQ